MDNALTQHLGRLRTTLLNRTTRADLLEFVCKNTYLNGKPFSTKGHEYQERILSDVSQEIVIVKPSQIGLSELSLRIALGLVNMIPNFSLIYTLPTATMASLYTKTRLDPIINGSPVLREAVRGELDSSEAKQLGPNNFLYVRGAAVGNSAIGYPADCVINDEVDFSDPNILEMLGSRMTHSPYRWGIKLSTPTTEGGPIDAAFQESRQHYNMVRCEHCNHVFFPNYWDHVKIPGYTGELRDITKETLTRIRYQEAALRCPHCDKVPSLLPAHREWVISNPNKAYIAAGYKLTPFDAPTFISTPSLVAVSTKYQRLSQFKNFHLGETASDAESGVQPEDIDRAALTLEKSPFTSHVIGIDLGLTCHFIVAGMTPTGGMVVVHMERVPLARFRERYAQLAQEYRASIKVSDLQPYTDLILSMSDVDANLYGATYVTRQGMDVYTVHQRDADVNNALAGVRQVSIARNQLFDRLLADLRGGSLQLRKTADWDILKAHACDMKRASATLRNGEFTSMWQKSAKGHDHYWHAVAYAWVANQMRGLTVGAFMVGLPAISKFTVRHRG